MESAVKTVCPVCEAEVKIADGTVVGELLDCSECGTELEVTSTDPIAIQEAPEVEEDCGE